MWMKEGIVEERVRDKTKPHEKMNRKKRCKISILRVWSMEQDVSKKEILLSLASSFHSLPATVASPLAAMLMPFSPPTDLLPSDP